MISYSTEFPIDEKNSVEDVLLLAWKWIVGSRHTNIPESALSSLPVDSELHLAFGSESVTISAACGDGFSIGGIRYTRIEDKGLEWITSIVTIKTPLQHLLSIQISCEALNTAARLPAPKKPVFIHQALTSLGGGMDGSIPVVDKPFYLNEPEVQVAAQLISGTGENRLPIVYISANYDGSHIVSPAELAKLVSGVAHVFVEPSREFSAKLKKLTGARNVYGGTVGVYWPESEAKKSYYFDSVDDSSEIIQINIANDIRIALSNRRQRTNCNWLYLKEVISRRHYEKLKAEGSTQLDEFASAFDAELTVKSERIAEAEQEIARLNAELKRYGAAFRTSTNGLLKPGEEQDLFAGEIQDIVIDALQSSFKNSHADSRRQHVISDILSHNQVTGSAATIQEEIKRILKGYVNMDVKTRTSLTKLGFDITDDGKHYKAVFQGDGRYMFSISKTSSDHKSGMNLASDISKKLFL